MLRRFVILNDTCCVVLAAGEGKRMKSEIPKVLVPVLFEPMLEWVIDTAYQCQIKYVCVVTGYKNEMVKNYLNKSGHICKTVVQNERRGTAHAVMCADSFLRDNMDFDVLILGGDSPFIDKSTILEAYKMHKSQNNSATIISSNVKNPFGYGRIVRNRQDMNVNSIIEEKDATPDQRKITEINSGAYWFKVKHLLDSIYEITNQTSQNEFYLTDSIKILINKGFKVDAYKALSPEIILGANDCVQLQNLNSIVRNFIINKMLSQGVDIPFSDGVIIGRKVKIEPGSRILPGTVIYGETTIGKGCTVGPNSQIIDCKINDNVNINSSFCKNITIEKDAKIGPFECKDNQNH